MIDASVVMIRTSFIPRLVARSGARRGIYVEFRLILARCIMVREISAVQLVLAKVTIWISNVIWCLQTKSALPVRLLHFGRDFRSLLNFHSLSNLAGLS